MGAAHRSLGYSLADLSLWPIGNNQCKPYLSLWSSSTFKLSPSSLQFICGPLASSELNMSFVQAQSPSIRMNAEEDAFKKGNLWEVSSLCCMAHASDSCWLGFPAASARCNQTFVSEGKCECSGRL